MDYIEITNKVTPYLVTQSRLKQNQHLIKKRVSKWIMKKIPRRVKLSVIQLKVL